MTTRGQLLSEVGDLASSSYAACKMFRSSFLGPLAKVDQTVGSWTRSVTRLTLWRVARLIAQRFLMKSSGLVGKGFVGATGAKVVLARMA